MPDSRVSEYLLMVVVLAVTVLGPFLVIWYFYFPKPARKKSKELKRVTGKVKDRKKAEPD